MSLKKIPLAGVIGSPIAQSKSPQLQRHWLKTYGLQGFYIPMDIKAGDLRDVLATLPKMGFVGINVTAPHKE
ncbi:MAG: shikimate dehydrogenase, partial [Lentilitoribacter sp.]